MTDHTPTPWTYKRAKKPTDGQYDCAVTAVVDGERHIIAETFGRAAPDVFPDSEANAAFIVKAANSHDALVTALKEIADGYDNQDVNHVDYRVKVYQIALDALESIKVPA